MPKLAENKIDLIWFEQVPYYRSYNDADWERAMESLVAADPRIIIYDGEAGYAPMCWFYRYKIYGPNYAVILIHWVDSNTDAIRIPDYIKHWCTVDMVRHTINSSFIYGETGKGTLHPEQLDSLNFTGALMEDELDRRVQDIENIQWLHNKYSYYDCIMFAGFMLNEAERLLRLQNDSLINWTVDSEKFKQNGEYIVNLMKDAIYNIRVVGLRGIYDFYKNTSLNTGGGTPTPIYQCTSHPTNATQVRPVVFDGSELVPGVLKWEPGAQPFDRVQINKLLVRSQQIVAIIVLGVISAIIIIVMVVFVIVKKPPFSMGRTLLIFGVLIANFPIFLFDLLDVEPVSLHCSIVASLFGCGLSICFLGIWLVLETQLKIHDNFSARLRSKVDFTIPELAKSTMEKISIVVLILIFALLAALFVISMPFKTVKNEATLQMTFGKREIDLSTQVECKLALKVFSMVIIGITIAIDLLIILKTILVAYQIHLLKKQNAILMKKRKSKSKQPMKQPKDSVNIFIIFVTLIIATVLLLLLIGKYAAFVIAVTSMLFGVIVSAKIWFHDQVAA